MHDRKMTNPTGLEFEDWKIQEWKFTDPEWEISEDICCIQVDRGRAQFRVEQHLPCHEQAKHEE